MSLEYQEPLNSTEPKDAIYFEVIKSGVLIETTPHLTKSKSVLGRLPTNDLSFEHPSISRIHAIIQYTLDGVFIYDLASAHGTFVNKQRIPEKTHVQIYGGDFIKLGESTRFLVVHGIPPKSGSKQMTQKKTAHQPHLSSQVTWGFGEDAVQDENEQDYQLDENAFFAQEPKKHFRIWLESQGYDYRVSFQEHTIGNDHGYIASIQITDIQLEAQGFGLKKKDAEREACLDACYKLDRKGLMQSDSSVISKEKRKKLEELFGDEDTVYDTTTQPMKKKKQDIETFDTLSMKRKAILEELNSINAAIEKSEETKKLEQQAIERGDDELDIYMNILSSKMDQKTIDAMKRKIEPLKQELAHTEKLLALVTPSSMVQTKTLEAKAEPVDTKTEKLKEQSIETKRPYNEQQNMKIPQKTTVEHVDLEDSNMTKKTFGAPTLEQMQEHHYSIENDEIETAPDISKKSDMAKLNATYGY